MSPLIVIAANDIDVSGHSVDERLSPEWLLKQLSDAGATQAREGHAHVRLSRTGRRDIVARGRVEAAFSVACARCTEPAPIEVQAELTLLLKPSRAANPSPPRQLKPSPSRPEGGAKDKSKKPQAKDKGSRRRSDSETQAYEFSSEEADVEFYDGDEVVLDPFLREAILLEIPIFPLCSDQCAGIHPGPQTSAESAEPEAKRLSPLAALADFDLSKSSKSGPADAGHSRKARRKKE